MLLLDADDTLRAKLHAFAEAWKAEAELINVAGPLGAPPST